MTAMPFASRGGSQRIIFDGLNRWCAHNPPPQRSSAYRPASEKRDPRGPGEAYRE
jgi:hypothetical protein